MASADSIGLRSLQLALKAVKLTASCGLLIGQLSPQALFRGTVLGL